MIRQVAAFEIRYQLRQPLLWGTAGAFAALTFIATITDALQIGGAIGSVHRNAPYVVVRMLADLSLIGTFMVVAFMATSVLRDFERRTDELIFSRPISAGALLLGRFAGSWAAVCLAFACAAIGLLAGGLMPWVDRGQLGPLSVAAYAYGLLLLAFPTFAILGGIFFALASRVRHLAVAYAGLVALLVAYFTASAMFGDLESQPLAALLDPFGLTAFEFQTRYWTIADKNGRLPQLAGAVLWNRLLWLSLGLGALAWAVRTFHYETAARPRPRPAPAPIEGHVQTAATRVRRHAAFERSTAWSQLRASIALETRALLRSVPFLLILAFGLINVLSNIGYLDLMMGTPVWPVTYLMLLAISAGYSFLLILILAFYAGETVWRERSLSVDGLLDATPMPTWVPLTAKVTALWVASAVFIAAGMIALAGFQLSLGYRRLEPLVYAQGFVVEIVPFLLIAVLAVFLQATVNQKYVGYLLMVAYLISGAVLGYVHFDHHLYRYATAPAALYSDMNGWGHFKTAVAWFDAYWTFVAGALFCLAYLLWVRGSDTGWRPRLREARARWRGAVRIALPLTLAAAAIAGAWIYCNTNVRNEYIASDDADRHLAEYEQLYGRYRRLPQPTIVAVKSAVDIFPEERRADIRGTYRVVNRLTAPIAALHIAESPRVTIRKLALPPHRVVVDDRRHGYAIYELTTPLQPGQEFQFGFDLEIANPGFVNNAPDNAIVANGTFFHSAIFPSFGYQDSRELVDPSVRRRHGLPPPVRMARIDDMAARFHNDLARDADWIDFETTVSTSADQIAIAPGDLQREWSAGGRRYFHYVAARPIPKFFAYLSGRYTVRHDAWNGIAIDIYHHPDHPYNVSRMIDAVKKTLAYMAENFSPYQHRHVRIIEFPRYMRAAASFPGSIPFSESIGFIARLKSPSAIDYPFYVTAHEVAHQWWGYQVLGADVQGAAMLSESMAQYAALMVMRREYGPEKMRRFLKYELDGYLRGRGAEPVEELPLELVENQPYIHYRKGSLALYALQDAIGEAALNDALRRYIASVRFQAPPYTVSRELLAFVAAATPPSRQRLLDDLFRSITLFDLRADTASAMRLPDGRFEVALRVDARKLRADGQGVESEVPIDDWIDVGVFGERRGGGDPDQVLYLQKHHVTSTGTTLRIVVDGVPLRAGIDPFNTFIDRVSGDNVCAVQRNN